MRVFVPVLLLALFVSARSFGQKTLFTPTEWSDPANEFYQKISDSRKYESTNFVVYWGDKVGNDPSTYSDASLRFVPRSVADTLETSFKRYITDLKFCSNASTSNLGKYKIIVMMMNTWNSTDTRLQAFAQASSFSNTIGAMFCCPDATRDGGALSHEFAHCLQMMQHIQENTAYNCAFSGYDAAGPFFETHANFMRGQVYPKLAEIDGTLTRWIQTRHFMWLTMRHHYTCFHLMYYVQEKDGFDFTRRMWAESKANEHPLETIKRLKGFTQEQLNDYLWGYAQRQPAFDYPIQWDSKVHTDANFGATIRSAYQYVKAALPRYTNRQYTILTQVAGTTDQFYPNEDWAPQDYGMNIIPLYPTCSGTQKKVTIKFKGHTEVNSTYAGWRYGFITTKSDGTIANYGTMYSAAETEISYTFNTATEANLYLVVFSAPKQHYNYNMDEGYPKIRRYPYELKIANATPEGYQAASEFRKWQKTSGHTHSNGGGWVANGASVASTAYVGPYAMVLGGTVSGTARIEDWATVMGGTVSGNAVVKGNAMAYNATISDNAVVAGNGWMEGGSVTGSATVKGNAMVWSASYSNSVVVGGDAEIGNCSTNGVYLQPPYWRNGRNECDGKGASDASNTDINGTLTNFTAAQMAFASTPTCGATVTYTLTTSVVGSGTVSPASGTFDQGSVQTLTATPATGYAFSGWSGDATGTTNPLSVTMDKNKTITATFTAIPQYTLTATASGSGTVSPTSGSYYSGTVQTLTATPANGYIFSKWTGDATGTTNPLSVTMDKNKNITAVFIAMPSDTLRYSLNMTVMAAYTASAITLDATKITAAFGMTAAQISAALGTTINYAAVNGDGTLNTASTANAPGHWFSITSEPIAYGTDSYVYSELDLSKLVANVGQYPSRCTVGNSFVLKQVLYSASARVVIIINVKIVKPTITQSISLKKGWNLISINVSPTDSTITTLFTGLDVQEVKDMNTYWRKGQTDVFNGLKKITAGAGYLVNMNVAGTLTVTGTPVSFSNSQITTSSNWMLMGCPYQTATAISTDFSAKNCSVIKNLDGFWIPDATNNSITTQEPGKGYFIKR